MTEIIISMIYDMLCTKYKVILSHLCDSPSVTHIIFSIISCNGYKVMNLDQVKRIYKECRSNKRVIKPA